MTTTHEIPRSINYDAASGDYAMRLDGELVGYARSYSEAEITLDQLVFELLSHGATATASALDGDSDACAGEGDCPDCDSLIGCEVITCTQPATHFSASGAMSALCCACFVTAFGEPCGCASVAYQRYQAPDGKGQGRGIAMDQPMTPATPRLLRINLLETRVRSTLADIDAWRAASGKQVRVRGLKRGPYARLYLSLDCEPFPGELIDLLLPSIRERSGSIASVGAWIIQLEVSPLLDEPALWREVA